MSPGVHRLRGVVCLLALFAVARAARGAELSDEAVARAIDSLKSQLIEAQEPDGAWRFPGYTVGSTSLVVLALKLAGVANDHPAITRALPILLDQADGMTYSEALVICALEQVDPKRHRQRIEKAAQFLIGAQQGSGGWTYGPRGVEDNSNSQFAVLGLAAAMRCGVGVPRGVRERAVQYWERGRRKDGGWEYRKGSASSYMSMTCAGIASLTLLGVPLEEPSPTCGEYSYNRDLTNGLLRLRALLSKDSLGDPRWRHYTYYALERVGILLNLRSIGGIDWYRYGAKFLLENAGGDSASKAFSLLFLAKAAKPIAIAKWKWKGDWNNDHNDVRRWLEAVEKSLDMKFDWVAARCRSLDSAAAKASLVFVNGHTRFRLSPDQARFIRSFLASGGTVVGEACCNRRSFAETFRREMATKLWPGRSAEFGPIPANHPIYTCYHRLPPEKAGVSQLRRSGCKKPRVFLLAEDISCALNGEARTFVGRKTARKLATNLLVFAVLGKEPRGKLNRETLDEETLPELNLTVDQVRRTQARRGTQFRQPLGRLKHRGDWLADPGFFPSLREHLRASPRVPEFDGEVYVDPTSDDLFQAPVLFMTGHEDPDLAEPEALCLRSYLQNGGFLLVSACCGAEAFDAGFRRLLKTVLPHDELELIPKTDALYLQPYRLQGEAVAGTQCYAGAYGQGWAELFGIRRQGRWIVVYSPVDLCCALEGDLEEDVLGYKREHGLRLLANALTYSMGLVVSDGDDSARPGSSRAMAPDGGDPPAGGETNAGGRDAGAN